MATTDIITKRIHVGGLTPSITPDHIKDRFKSFGNVLDVEELGVDGLGQPRPFTFFTLQTTPSQLKKCLNIMSGSMWRGCQLRLADAKPKYEDRLIKERNPTKEAVEERLRKRKRRILTARGPDTGKEAQDMRVPDERNYQSKKFWTQDANGHLVRPIAIRPSRTLPPTAVASTSAKPNALKRRGAPVRRSRVRVINPSLWRPSHLAQSDMGEGRVTVGEVASRAGWTFESDDEGDKDEDGRVLVGRWVTLGEDGDVEEVWVQGRTAQGIIPVEEEEEDDTVSDIVNLATTRERSASPLFASRRLSGSASPLFPGRRAELPSADELVSEHDNGETSGNSVTLSPQPVAIAERSASPLFPTRQTPVSSASLDQRLSKQPVAARKSTAPSEPDVDDTPNPMREAAKAERSRDLSFLAAFLGEEVHAADKPTKGEWAGFAEDDEGDEEDLEPLRLRGGRADSDDDEDDEDMSDSSDSDSDSSNESDSDHEVEAPSAATAPAPAAASTVAGTGEGSAPAAFAPAPKPQSALKAMFAPAPAQSNFSLLGALDADIELDDELDIPLAPPPVHRALEPEPELQPLAQSKKSRFDPDPNIPLFLPSFGKGGKDVMREETEKEGYQGFWRQETDEDMKEIWERDKVELTRDWKKRYRDGKKQKKRRGGANEVE